MANSIVNFLFRIMTLILSCGLFYGANSACDPDDYASYDDCDKAQKKIFIKQIESENRIGFHPMIRALIGCDTKMATEAIELGAQPDPHIVINNENVPILAVKHRCFDIFALIVKNTQRGSGAVASAVTQSNLGKIEKQKYAQVVLKRFHCADAELIAIIDDVNVMKECIVNRYSDVYQHKDVILNFARKHNSQNLLGYLEVKKVVDQEPPSPLPTEDFSKAEDASKHLSEQVAKEKAVQHQAASVQAAKISGLQSRIRAESDKIAQITSAHSGAKRSVWRNTEGNFNTTRLASDSIAGAALGTVGGLITHNIIKKNQLSGGFEDINCSVGGEMMSGFGDVFRVSTPQK